MVGWEGVANGFKKIKGYHTANMKILFLCKSNTGRSQMAEALFNAVSKQHHALSAGTLVKEKEGQKIHPNVIESMGQIGLNLSQKTKKQVTPLLVEQADKIIVMDEDQNIPDYVRNSGKMILWSDVPDAVGTSLEFHCEVRDKVKAHINALVKEVG